MRNGSLGMLNETLVNYGGARWIWLKKEYEWTHNLQVPELLVASFHMVNNFKQYSSDVENEHEESRPLYAAVTQIMGYQHISGFDHRWKTCSFGIWTQQIPPKAFKVTNPKTGSPGLEKSSVFPATGHHGITKTTLHTYN